MCIKAISKKTKAQMRTIYIDIHINCKSPRERDNTDGIIVFP